MRWRRACCAILRAAQPTRRRPRARSQLVLRSINSSKSAFMSVSYNEPFFELFNVVGAHVVQSGVLMKVRGRRR